MTLTADRLPDSVPLPRDVLDRVRDARRRADAAEVEILELALAWADAHPVLPGEEAWRPTPGDLHPDDLVELPAAAQAEVGEDEVTWAGIPSVRWDAPAGFAAANGMSTTAGKALGTGGVGRDPRGPGAGLAGPPDRPGTAGSARRRVRLCRP